MEAQQRGIVSSVQGGGHHVGLDRGSLLMEALRALFSMKKKQIWLLQV